MLAYVQEFFTLFLGLIIEAFPFIVLGVTVSTLIALFIKDEWIMKYVPKNRFISHPIIALLGIVLPVCECGNVPVTRRFLASGFSVSQSITFLLAAPIVNPITFLTTLEAFNINPHIAYARIFAGFVVALLIGLSFSFMDNQESLLHDDFFTKTCGPTHDHTRNLAYGLEIFQREFFKVFKMLFIGAAIAALTQSLIPRDIIVSVGHHPVFSVFAMIFLGFIVSMCSNVDAFFALAYSQTFTMGSLMAFMVFGPMIDVKILSMLRSTFKTRTLVVITVMVTVCSVIIGLGINLL